MSVLGLGLAGNLRSAFAAWRQRRGIAAAIVVTVSVGAGAASAVFSVVNATLLRPLPYPHSDRIVQFVSTTESGGSRLASIPKFLFWDDTTSAFEMIAACQVRDPGISLVVDDRPDRLAAVHVSAGYFSVLGAPVIAGRAFLHSEDRPNGPPVVVLSHSLFLRRFGGDRGVVGRSIRLGGRGYLVVGVIGPSFVADPPADVWLTLQADPTSGDHTANVEVIALMKSGVSLESAHRQVFGTTNWFRRRFPFALAPSEEFAAVSLHAVRSGHLRPALTLLATAACCLFLIASANVASLLLSCGVRRQLEFGTRLALGASPAQLFRQLLAESALLSLLGGAVGLALARTTVAFLLSRAPSSLRLTQLDPGSALSWEVILFAFGLSSAVGLVFGMIPALPATRVNLAASLRGGFSPTAGWRRAAVQPVLVVAQIALAFVLVVGTTVLLRATVALSATERGFDPRNVISVDMPLNGAGFDQSRKVEQLLRLGGHALSGLDGVLAVAVARGLPTEPGLAAGLAIESRSLFQRGAYHGTARVAPISTRYFDVLRIKLLRGRTFAESDAAGAPPVVVINAALARRYWQDLDPLGERLTLSSETESGRRPWTIVGVVDDVRADVVGAKAEPTVYVPLVQLSDAATQRDNRLFALTWLLRTRDGGVSLGRVEPELRAASGGVSVARWRSFERVAAEAEDRAAFAARLLGAFAVLALLLAAVGLYSLMSYAFERRIREFAIRLALGAAPTAVRKLMLAQAIWVTGLGIAIGLVGAIVSVRAVRAVAVAVDSSDPVSLAVTAAFLALVALIAALLPTRKVHAIDPMRTLHQHLD